MSQEDSVDYFREGANAVLRLDYHNALGYFRNVKTFQGVCNTACVMVRLSRYKEAKAIINEKFAYEVHQEKHKLDSINGLIALYMGDWKEAKQFLESAFFVAPNDSMCKLNFAKLLRDQDDYDRAIQMAREVVESIKDSNDLESSIYRGDAYRLWCVLLQETYRYSDFEKVLKEMDRDDLCHVRLVCSANMLKQQGRIHEALVGYKKLAESVENDNVLCIMANIYGSILNKTEIATDMFEKALKLNPQNPLVYTMYASMLLNLSKKINHSTTDIDHRSIELRQKACEILNAGHRNRDLDEEEDLAIALHYAKIARYDGDSLSVFQTLEALCEKFLHNGCPKYLLYNLQVWTWIYNSDHVSWAWDAFIHISKYEPQTGWEYIKCFDYFRSAIYRFDETKNQEFYYKNEANWGQVSSAINALVNRGMKVESDHRGVLLWKFIKFVANDFYTKEVEKTKVLFEKVINAFSFNIPEVYYDYGVFSVRIKEYDNALKLFSNVLRKNPNDVLSHLQLAYAYQQLKRIDEARVEYQQAVKSCEDIGNDVDMSYFESQLCKHDHLSMDQLHFVHDEAVAVLGE